MKSFRNKSLIPLSRVSIVILLILAACTRSNDQGAYPWEIPQEKPDRKLSAAMERLYDNYLTPRPEDNELYSGFRYTELKGFDYNNGDGTISRRDPSKIIFENGKYYVWYTHRESPTPPKGAANCNDTIPSSDWDLADIWYATSTDGFTWEEQGLAVARPPKPNPGWRSISTTDILKWKGKYYLYFQSFIEPSGTRGDYCPVSVAYADSPDGPWTHSNKLVIPNGKEGEWDQYVIHDPYPLVYKGKIYLYYKSGYGERGKSMTSHGLATADNPLGPFTKHPLNPVSNSGHETTLFPFKEGIAALIIRNGNENNTIQYAPDGVNFNIAAVSSMMPWAAGPYVPDAFDSNGDGRGITWGLSHIINATSWDRNHTILVRFDCDLSLDFNDPDMKDTQIIYPPEAFYARGLNARQRAERMK